jgi:zinc protease
MAQTTGSRHPLSVVQSGNEGDPQHVHDGLPKSVTHVTEEDGIGEYRLENGMKVLLVENRVAPVVTVLVLYKVGSRNEAVGYTGSTHLLEHMMFKGTPTFNKSNNTQIAGTLQKIGADFNATTWYDRTNYFETVPSDQLELAIKLEADRMRNSFIADSDRQSEMTVVRNELERGQNEPAEVLDEAVYATAFHEHPYHHPTIGWRSDVEGVPTSRLKEFFDTFYHPNNATTVIVGDFDRSNALVLVDKYFGAHPASQQPIPEVYTSEPPQQGERRLVIRRAGELALIQMGFHTPAVLGQMTVLSNEELAQRATNPPEENDIFPLVVLSAAMSNGVTSRLYQALVENELAVSIQTNADQHRDPGLFNIYATVSPGVDPGKVEDAILAELQRLTGEGLSDAEVEKAKRQILASEAFGRDGTFNIAVQISEAEAIADWRFYRDYSTNISKVTPADIQRVASLYLTEDNRTVGHFIPKQSGNGNGTLPAAASLFQTDLRNAFPRSVKFYDEPDAEKYAAAGTDATDASLIAPAAHQQSSQSESQATDAGQANTSASVSKPGFASRILRHQLPNGATLLALENRATPTVAVRGSLRAGSYFEPRDKPGLAQITAEMLSRGTKRRSKLEVADDLESVGADIDFSTDPFAVNIVARSLSQDLPLVINTLAEELREPAFPAEELDKLKQQMIASIQEQQASTRYRSYERFSGLIFDETNPYFVAPGPKLIDSISSITVDDVQNFYSQRYGGRSLVLTIVGNVDPATLPGSFAEAFGSFTGPTDVEVEVEDPIQQTATQREVVLLKDKANVDILIGSAAPLRRSSEDFYAAVLANSALGQSTLSSRLGLQVRDKEGLTYGINSSFSAPSLAAGPWFIGVSVNPGNVERAIESALEVVRDYVENGMRPEELDDEKSAAIGSFKVGLATNRGLARAIWNAEYYGLGLDYLDHYPDIITTVTLEQVNSAIRKYFRPDHITIVIAGDYETAVSSAVL